MADTNSMTPAEIAAYVGAAAWLPQIATWAYRTLVKPLITVVPDRTAEIGFTSYGPIFNIRMAFSADHKDAIIEGFEIDLTHEDGERHTFRWSGLQETLGETRDAAGNQKEIGVKDQVPIAVKIGTESLLEKYVRFQETRYWDEVRRLVSELTIHNNYLKQKDEATSAEETLSSKQFHDLISAREQWFWWKPGVYRVKLRLSSAKKFKLTRDSFKLKFTQLDVDHLKLNFTTMKTEVINIVKAGVPEFKPAPVNWNWAYAEVQKDDQ